jgi:hypothetical protein
MVRIKVWNFSLFVVLSVFATSCKEYSNIIKEAKDNKEKHPEQRVFDGEVEPDFPNESQNDKNLLGVDSNNNGIRDDVETWINFIGHDYNHRMALKMLAKSEVKRLIAGDKDDKFLKTQAAKDYWDAFLCVRYIENSIFGNEVHLSDDLIKIFYNTKKRVKAYEKFDSGTIVYESNVKNIEAGKEFLTCGFKIENLNDVISKYNKSIEEYR